MLSAGRARAAGPLLALIALLVALPVALAPAGVAHAALVRLDPIPDDEVRERQEWVLQALNVEPAWELTKGSGVTVAVIDSGVDDELAELRGRVTTGPDMRSPLLDRNPRPGRHGTAMASLIAGSGKDDGLTGTAPEATLLSMPVIPDQPIDGEEEPLPENGVAGRDSSLARAIRYATNHGADVINMSLGGYGPHPGEREAVAYALSRGVVLVAAVGNDGRQESTRVNGTSYWNFPAGYSGVIGVAAVGPEGLPASFSSDNLSVLVSAPGVNVPVAMPGGEYVSAEGTSGAAALVSGVVALIKARHPGMRPETVARALTRSARGRASAGYDEKVGFGVVDAAGALRAADSLTGVERSLVVPNGRHFGEGPLSAAPAPPGPDPVKLWTYTGAVLLGLVAFGGAVMLLTRRAEQKAALRRDPYGLPLPPRPPIGPAAFGGPPPEPPGPPARR